MQHITRFRRARPAIEATGALITALAFISGAMAGAHWHLIDNSLSHPYPKADQVACLISSADH